MRANPWAAPASSACCGVAKCSPRSQAARQLSRRSVLLGGTLAAAGLAAGPAVRELLGPRAAVFVARASRCDGSLVGIIRDGLKATGLMPEELRGRTVLLKPNLVEPDRNLPHLTTHPAVVRATAEVFRAWGSRVVVAEGPGHVRDTELALVESGLSEPLAEDRLPFVDLNYEDVVWTENRGRQSRLDGFHLPRSVVDADLIVSLPKLKTHHWTGVTAAMKNLYGILPGLQYGWPKNVLHHAGIPETVFDILATAPPTVAVVDAIQCMEGDGPILGTARDLGCLIVGRNLPAVDATACRLMELDPRGVPYLAMAADRLGPIVQRRITQRGEAWQSLAQRFEILDVPHLMALRPATGSA